MAAKFLFACLASMALFSLFNAHPHPYDWSKMPKQKAGEIPQAQSYHIHCLFVNGDSSVVNEALTLRNQFIAQFNLSTTPLCTSTFNNGRFCMFDIELIPDLDSPFVSGNWAVFVPVPWFAPTVQWAMQHRGNMSIFVHPNSGAETSDHKVWSLWGGQTWPINYSAFSNKTYY